MAIFAPKTPDFIHARRPPPLLLGAALTPQTAEWMGTWADGLITGGGSSSVVDAFRHGGGANKPVFLQVVLSYDPDEAQALQAAHDQWRHGALDSTQLATLSMPSEFDAATR